MDQKKELQIVAPFLFYPNGCSIDILCLEK
jgi:hypothetical protein